MALAKGKQQEIVTLSKEIESLLVKKFKKIDKNLTFGGKLKSIDSELINPFLKDALWSIVKIRNHVVHDNDIKISLHEYNLFLELNKYVSKKL